MLDHQQAVVAVMEASEEDGTVAPVNNSRGGRGGRGVGEEAMACVQ
jgi:hypothetical protein